MKASVQINQGIESLFGTRDENIRVIESGLGVSTHLLDSHIEIQGAESSVLRAERILEDYVEDLKTVKEISRSQRMLSFA